MPGTKPLPLEGLRILDLSTEIAGPYATKLLADAGADVIKLESPEGDPLRRWSASHTPIAEGANGALFEFLNTLKQPFHFHFLLVASLFKFLDMLNLNIWQIVLQQIG